MERILHSWPITLRVAVLLAVLFTGTVVLAVVLGVAGQLLLAVLGLRTQQQRRQRLDALRDETSQIEESGDS